jgi:hypothetical protein
MPPRGRLFRLDFNDAGFRIRSDNKQASTASPLFFHDYIYSDPVLQPPPELRWNPVRELANESGMCGSDRSVRSMARQQEHEPGRKGE